MTEDKNKKKTTKKTGTKQKKEKLDKKAKNPGINKKRQKKSVEIQAENVGTISIAQQMRDAGYSFNYSRANPHKHTRSKSFKDLIEEYLPEEDLLITHKSLKNSRKIDKMDFPTDVEDEVINELIASTNCILRKIVYTEKIKYAFFWTPDNKARKDALDMAYKIRGMYAPEKVEDVSKSKYKELSDEELNKRRNEAIKYLKKK